jgi:ArsR family transcriptional regulator, virulence genes transcriptional regulator
MDNSDLEQNARKASALLKSMANERRLLILCHLAQGEKSVSELEGLVGLSQSALSQHLARLRHDKLVSTRRAAQTIFYSLSGREAGAIMETLYSLYCDPVKAPVPPETAPPSAVDA